MTNFNAFGQPQIRNLFSVLHFELASVWQSLTMERNNFDADDMAKGWFLNENDK